MNLVHQSLETATASPLLRREGECGCSLNFGFLKALGKINKQRSSETIPRRRPRKYKRLENRVSRKGQAGAIQRDGIEEFDPSGAHFGRVGSSNVHIHLVGMIHLRR